MSKVPGACNVEPSGRELNARVNALAQYNYDDVKLLITEYMQFTYNTLNLIYYFITNLR